VDSGLNISIKYIDFVGYNNIRSMVIGGSSSNQIKKGEGKPCDKTFYLLIAELKKTL
jgi:hypothetical protein